MDYDKRLTRIEEKYYHLTNKRLNIYDVPEAIRILLPHKKYRMLFELGYASLFSYYNFYEKFDFINKIFCYYQKPLHYYYPEIFDEYNDLLEKTKYPKNTQLRDMMYNYNELFFRATTELDLDNKLDNNERKKLQELLTRANFNVIRSASTRR